MRIAVFGSAVSSTSEINEKARIIGEEIAKAGALLITGGCAGLPWEAAKAAKQVGGKTLGFSPAKNLEEHKIYDMPTGGYTDLRFVPQSYPYADIKSVSIKYRNVTSCAETDACVIIGGRIGTLNEFTNMYDMGKAIGVLEGSGGCTEYIDKVIKIANKQSGAIVIFERDPKKLLQKIIAAL